MSVTKNCGFNCKEIYDFIGFGSSNGALANVEVVGTFPINVQEVVTVDNKKYTVSLIDHQPLLANITINAIVTNPDTSIEKNGIIPIIGVPVISMSLGWSFSQDGNPVDVFQQVNGNQISPNTTKSLVLSPINLTSSSLLQDRTMTLFGDDEQNLEGSTVTDTAILQFGNRIWFGEGEFEDVDADLRALLVTLDEDLRLDDTVYILPQSLESTIYVYIAIPTSLAASTAFKDINSPSTADPMMVHKTNFTLSNGVNNTTYTVYISKQSALRGSIIVTV